MMERWLILGVVLALTVNCSKDDDDPAVVVATEDFTLKGAGSSEATLKVASDGIDPEELQIKLYSFAVSENEDCTDMIEVYSDEDPSYTDMLEGPEFGKQELADGEYKCIAYKMADYVKFIPSESTDDGACTAGATEQIEICRGNDEEGTAGVHFDDEEFECTEGDEDIITFYVSTVSESVAGSGERPEVCDSQDGNEPAACSSFRKPDADNVNRGMNLASSLQKKGAATGYIVVDGTGKVSSMTNDGESTCEMDAPAFSFYSE